MGNGGKGSGRRPDSVSTDQFSKNWDAIFAPKPSPQPHPDTQPQNGDIEISRTGQTLKYSGGYWIPVDHNFNNSH